MIRHVERPPAAAEVPRMSSPPGPPAAARPPRPRNRPLRTLFNRLSFRIKFVVVGLAIAGPLATLAGFAASTYWQAVVFARDRTQAIELSTQVRDLMHSLALHRGLSAQVLAGAEGRSRALVEQQRDLAERLPRTLAGFDTPRWQAVGPPDPAGIAEEVAALMRLPDAADPRRNFERHNEVIDALRAVLYRLSLGAAGRNARLASAVYDIGFAGLPSLMEDLARQRGAGSGVLAQSQYDPSELTGYMLYAGAAVQRLAQLRADRASLRDIAAAIDGDPPGPGAAAGGERGGLVDALNQAEVFSQRSLAQVMSRDGGAERAHEHFAEGTSAIQALDAVAQRIAASLQARAVADQRDAERGLALSTAALGLVIAALALVYLEFERSTVLRLRLLQLASQHIANGHFDREARVDGADEIAALGTALDTMRQRLRQALDERAGALAAREFDRARAEFLARWSHDLRTPLAALLGFASLLDAEPDAALGDRQRADLGRIRLAAEHLLALVDDLLALSVDAAAALPAADASGRPPAHEPGPGPRLALRDDRVSVDAAAAQAIVLTSHLARAAGVVVQQHDSPKGPCWARGDRTRLVQVLSNLVGNAIKFNRPGGRVDLRSGQDDAGHAWVAVEDTGSGIAAADLGRVFTPLDRLDAAERGIPGTGLGLATVKRLAEDMGGQVAVTSRVGEGSRFTVTLQAAPPEPAAAGPSAAPGRAPAPRGRLAYVEDDETNALLLQAVLRRLPGVELTVFATAAQALQAAGPFDLWLIDGQLPDGDGFGLLAELRARHGPALRAVMYSADARTQAGERARAMSFLDYWIKPMPPQALAQGLARWLSPAAPG
jgi:signal transduction histidine kinase/CheY-like chemotaxis protein